MTSKNDVGMITKIWGPSFWNTLHTITFCYPEEPTQQEKNKYKSFFVLIGDVLPCVFCRESYKTFITQGSTQLNNDALQNRKTLTEWLYNIHEAVNHKLGVYYGISFQDLEKRFESYRIQCHHDNVSNNEGKCGVIDEVDTTPFQNAYCTDCPIIPRKIANHFIEYAKQRGLDQSNFYLVDSEYNKYDEIWKKRNSECCMMIKEMRLNGIKSIEVDGEWAGLPTIDELKLIMRQSSNLTCETLLEMIKQNKILHNEFTKIYKINT
jgi:hypothetical protein